MTSSNGYTYPRSNKGGYKNTISGVVGSLGFCLMAVSKRSLTSVIKQLKADGIGVK